MTGTFGDGDAGTGSAFSAPPLIQPESSSEGEEAHSWYWPWQSEASWNVIDTAVLWLGWSSAANSSVADLTQPAIPSVNPLPLNPNNVFSTVHTLASNGATITSRAARVGQNARDADHTNIGAAYEMVGVTVAEQLAISDLTLWWEGDDPVTAEKHGTFERYTRATASTAGVILFVVGPAFGKGASVADDVILAEVVPEAGLGTQSIIVGLEAKPVMSQYVASMTGRSRTGDFLDDAIASAYQRFYDEAWLQAVAKFNKGQIPIPAGMSWKTVLGRETDWAARRSLKKFLARQNIAEGRDADILVNRYLRNPVGPGHRVPDVRLLETNTILDGTIGSKDRSSQQVIDFLQFSGGQVILVRPRVRPMFGGGS